ncbi:hypothetical protein K431DRAFT_339663 [Polychaeton citri CBS 116435]|uniref:Mitochondrial outer membrane transport complex Sam37/metaxin N-terminal domain-containing protein n=1 Tax=Polychaeton citri CBS 116435 TaxID=1314669 RepID=A0A9P4UPG6_9PEZI|nr:hypothetical protein K431DRAFT_339663 [Polychaeton citri CBS 116435]
MIQLQVLGPAFGLPSIDAECNAAVALLKSFLAKAGTPWELVPVHDERQAPCLVVDAGSRHTGFGNIARYVEEQYADFVLPLSGQQLGDSVALTSFLDAHGPTLLAVHLYVSFENWRHATRPAFTAMLPLLSNWTLPPRLRSQARAATDHLGISSIDVDNVHDTGSNPSGQDFSIKEDEQFEKAAQKRASLLLPRKETLRSLLSQPQHAATFKLHSLAQDFLGPLQDLLGDGAWLLGTTRPTTADFLAYGYLGLMLKPNVPQDWLAKLMKGKYSALAAYVDRMHDMLQLETKVEDVVSLGHAVSGEEVDSIRRYCLMGLPWTAPAVTSSIGIIGANVARLVSRIPVINDRAVIIQMEPAQLTFWQRHLALICTTLTAAVAAEGHLLWPRGENVHFFGKKRLSDYGHLGAALSGIALIGPQSYSRADAP